MSDDTASDDTVSRGPEPDRPTEPLIIGGSHLQSLIYAVCGAMIAIVWRDSVVGWPMAATLALFVASGAVAYRRCELHDDHLTHRRLGSTISADVGDFEAALGHRYLSVTTRQGRRFRIEVPVEIRPDVRDWAVSRSVDLDRVGNG
ncbi:MAG: hypothetical protein R2710_12520 [Acidimicrobiales bacterium]